MANGEEQSTVESALSGMSTKDDATVASDANDIKSLECPDDECYEALDRCCFNRDRQVLDPYSFPCDLAPLKSRFQKPFSLNNSSFL